MQVIINRPDPKYDLGDVVIYTPNGKQVNVIARGYSDKLKKWGYILDYSCLPGAFDWLKNEYNIFLSYLSGYNHDGRYSCAYEEYMAPIVSEKIVNVSNDDGGGLNLL
jgi:hypothetical protein